MSKLNRVPPGRDNELSIFSEKRESLRSGGKAVVVFYGPGGQGKTEICSSMASLLRDRSSNPLRDPYCVIDFKAQERNKIDVLYSLRMALSVGSILKHPSFDIALRKYFERTRLGFDIKQRYPELFLESKAFSDVGEAADIAWSAVTDVTQHVPLAGLAQKYLLRMVDAYGSYRAQQGKTILANLDTFNDDQILNCLPVFLSQDISESLVDGEVPIFLFDHYEHLWERGMVCDGLIDVGIDSWCRMFFENLSCGLGIIFSRERLDHWAELSTTWNSNTLIHVELQNLTARTSFEILRAVEIREKAIRKHIIRLSNGHPLYLKVLIDTYHSLTQAGRQPQTKDFGAVKKDVIARFLDHLNQNVALCLKILSAADEIDFELFEFLSECFPSAFSGLSFSIISHYSFFQNRSDDEMVMHSVMRNGLQSLTDERTKIKSLRSIFNFFEQRFQEVKDKKFEQAHDFLLKAASYRTRYDEVGFVEWLLQIEVNYMTEPFARFLEIASAIAQQNNLFNFQGECLWRLIYTDSSAEYVRGVLTQALKLSEYQKGIYTSQRIIQIQANLLLAKHRLGDLLEDNSKDFIDECKSLHSKSNELLEIASYWLIYISYILGCAYGRAGNYEEYENYLREAIDRNFELQHISLEGYKVGYRSINRLITLYRFQNRFSDSRLISNKFLIWLNKSNIEKFIETLFNDTEDLRIELEMIESNKKILAEIGRCSDAELGRRISLPMTTGEDPQSPELQLLEYKFTGNMGIVINGKGRVCIVYDERFVVLPDEVINHVRYDAKNCNLYLVFGANFVFKIDWKVLDEIDICLKNTDKILLIRLENQKPVDGYDTSLLVCNIDG